jgi:hypothetical protein
VCVTIAALGLTNLITLHLPRQHIDMDRYVYLSSDESDAYFADNRVYKFKVHLKTPLTFNGVWKVGLLEFEAAKVKTTKGKGDEALYVFTNICKESVLQGVEQPLLRRLQSNAKSGWSYVIEWVIYLPLKVRDRTEFEVYIKTSDGAVPSFLA